MRIARMRNFPQPIPEVAGFSAVRRDSAAEYDVFQRIVPRTRAGMLLAHASSASVSKSSSNSHNWKDRSTTMVRVVCPLAVFLVMLPTTPLLAQDKALIDKGQQVYTAQKCTFCHSVAGKGNAKGPLDSVGGKLTADDIRMWITNPKQMTEKTKAARKPVMKEYPDLTKADVDALVAYLQTLKK
jgi:mono/diheme cytochrome c family protein